MARGKRFTHNEWVYTGNHPNGENHIYQNGVQELIEYIGASEDDYWPLLSELQGDLFHEAAPHVDHNGYRISIVGGKRGRNDGFGYEYTIVYRAEKL